LVRKRALAGPHKLTGGGSFFLPLVLGLTVLPRDDPQRTLQERAFYREPSGDNTPFRPFFTYANKKI
jgi:hypothetical protein